MSHKKYDNALFELGKAQQVHTLATESLKQIQESRAARFKELQDSKNNAAQRELYEEAVQQERAAKSDVRLAMDQLKKKQSNYDKLKQRASNEKKAQKKREAKKQKPSEQEENTKNNDKNNENAETIEDQTNEEQDETRDQEQFREQFFKGRYNSHLPDNLEFPEKLATKFLSKPSAWKTACDQALSDRSQMVKFPDPPYKGCGDRTCVQSRKERFLKACRCNIIDAFMRDPDYPNCMKTERLRWHPDKFSVCAEKWRDVFQGKASEIFVVADFLYKRDAKDE